MPIYQYEDLVKIPVKENNEPLISIQENTTGVLCQYEKPEMLRLTGEKMQARKSLVTRLNQAQQSLEKRIPKAKLRVVYAYRAPEIQKQYFNKRKQELLKETPNISEDELVRKSHLLSASPDVAGHPAGAAIDVTITTPSGDLDMGTKIADFFAGEAIQSLFPNITPKQQKNRALLREVLMNEGFAPFDGEWWHFSYGDRDWAAYYKKSNAIYGQIIL